jgi:DNA polymerase-3 subunit chi
VTADTAELSAALWSQPEWLPHGTVADGDPDLQPIWLSSEPDAANGARYLFLLDDAGAATNRLTSFDRVFDLFDGNNPVSVAAARARWKAAKAAEHVLSYWQQGKTGWQKKA